MTRSEIQSVFRKYGISQKRIADMVGKDESSISKLLSRNEDAVNFDFLTTVVQGLKKEAIEPNVFSREKFSSEIIMRAAMEIEEKMGDYKTFFQNFQQGNDNRFNEGSVIEKVMESYTKAVEQYISLLSEKDTQMNRLLAIIEKLSDREGCSTQ